MVDNGAGLPAIAAAAGFAFRRNCTRIASERERERENEMEGEIGNITKV